MNDRAAFPRRWMMAAALLLGFSLVACGEAAPATTPTPTQTAPMPATEPAQATYTPTTTTAPSQTSTPAPTESGLVTLIAVGDLMLGRSVGEQILEKGPEIIFAGVQDALSSGDIRIGNLECALTDGGLPEPRKTYTLDAPPEAAKALKAGAFDVLSLANNHAMDYGAEGLREAQKLLADDGIATVGAGSNYVAAHTPVILQKNGLRLAFLGYVNVPEERDGFNARDWIATSTLPGVAWADPTQMTEDIRAARKQADVVIVLLHAGIEIGEYMSIVSGDQREAARAAIDAGAAVVVGSHPHQLESIELYHGGLIAYSLGNFVFDDYRGIANATMILQVSLGRKGYQSYTYIPALIENGLPQVITPERAPAIGTLVAPMGP